MYIEKEPTQSGIYKGRGGINRRFWTELTGYQQKPARRVKLG